MPSQLERWLGLNIQVKDYNVDEPFFMLNPYAFSNPLAMVHNLYISSKSFLVFDSNPYSAANNVIVQNLLH